MRIGTYTDRKLLTEEEATTYLTKYLWEDRMKQKNEHLPPGRIGAFQQGQAT